METLQLTDLEGVHGGQVADAVNAGNRAAANKKGKGSLDIFGYNGTEKKGVGAELRHRLNDNTSIYVNGYTGTKNDKPDSGVMGGIRFEW
jgi:hypothetical protein